MSIIIFYLQIEQLNQIKCPTHFCSTSKEQPQERFLQSTLNTVSGNSSFSLPEDFLHYEMLSFFCFFFFSSNYFLGRLRNFFRFLVLCYPYSFWDPLAVWKVNTFPGCIYSLLLNNLDFLVLPLWMGKKSLLVLPLNIYVHTSWYTALLLMTIHFRKLY